MNFLPLGAPAEGAELLSAKSDGGELWFSGGGAASGPAAAKEPGGVVPSPPVLVHLVEPFYEQVPLETSLFGSEDRFVRCRPRAGRGGGVGRRSALLPRARQLDGQGEGRADRRRRSHDAGHTARQRPRTRQRLR